MEPGNYDISDVESELLDVQIERCQSCDWWFECSELVDDGDGEPGVCNDCREAIENT